MRQVEFVPFRLTDVAEIYSIRIEGKENSEIQEFIITFKDIPDKYLKDDFDGIIRNLIKISEKGAAESMFRPEGKIRDRVCALPLYTVPREKCKHGVLRLYCIRLSENLIIVGGGGEKSTRTYEEDKTLHEKIKILQQIDKELSILEDKGIDLNTDLNNITIQIQ